MSRSIVVLAAAVVMTTVAPGPLLAQEAGHVKVTRGVVQIERAGQKTPATIGAVVQAGDVVSTGADGSGGITFLDNSLLSAGPNSVLPIDPFSFHSPTPPATLQSPPPKGPPPSLSANLPPPSPTPSQST